jgi:hypothetical protein
MVLACGQRHGFGSRDARPLSARTGARSLQSAGSGEREGNQNNIGEYLDNVKVQDAAGAHSVPVIPAENRNIRDAIINGCVAASLDLLQSCLPKR